MNTAAKPTIVVINGTADEGYWAVKYLMQTGRFHVRTTVRRMTSNKVQRLQKLKVNGETCEIVQAATSDKAALIKAFEGARGIYGTSVYNIHAKVYRSANPEEMAQCHALIEAAKTCDTLDTFVWQTMTRFDVAPKDLGLEAPIHFRTKWLYEDIIKDAGLPWIFLRQPAYMRQMAFGMQYKNRLVYPYQPDSRLPYVAEEDLGKIVAAIFSDPTPHMHTSINAVSEIVTPVEMAQRAHTLNRNFKKTYRVATWLENAIFEKLIVGLNPSYTYPLWINRNIMAGNYFNMQQEDKEFCAALIAPLELNKIESWMEEHFKEKKWMG